MSIWVHLFANRKLWLFATLFLFFSCEGPKSYQADYSINVFCIGEDKSLVFSSNTSFSDFEAYSSPQNKGYIIPLGHKVIIDRYTWNNLSGLFHNNRFPKNLDGLFVIENISDQPQKCFLYLSNGYPSKRLKTSRFISKSKISVDDIVTKVNTLAKKMDYKSLSEYWEEIHLENQDIALEIPPKKRILIPWR